MTTPVFRAIKEHLPLAYVAVMVPQRIGELFEDNPYLDEIIIFDERNQHRSFASKLSFVKYLRAKNFDTAFLLHRSFTRTFILWLAGIRERIGFRRFKNFFVLTKRIKEPANNVHRQDRYLYLFEKSGIEILDKGPEVFVSEGLRARCRTSLSDIREKYPHIVGMHPSANWEPKRWPAKSFACLADRLITELHCAIIFVGSDKDRVVVNEVIGTMKCTPYDFCGKTSIKELMALIEGMDIFVSNDSGPAHLAASSAIDTVVLFGPTSTEVTSPRGKRVSVIKGEVDCTVPCYRKDCQDNICMKSIKVEYVFREIKRLLDHA